MSVDKAQIVWGALNADGTIHEFGRTDPNDPYAESPAGYDKAVKRGLNVSFLTTDEEQMAKLEGRGVKEISTASVAPVETAPEAPDDGEPADGPPDEAGADTPGPSGETPLGDDAGDEGAERGRRRAEGRGRGRGKGQGA